MDDIQDMIHKLIYIDDKLIYIDDGWYWKEEEHNNVTRLYNKISFVIKKYEYKLPKKFIVKLKSVRYKLDVMLKGTRKDDDVKDINILLREIKKMYLEDRLKEKPELKLDSIDKGVEKKPKTGFVKKSIISVMTFLTFGLYQGVTPNDSYAGPDSFGLDSKGNPAYGINPDVAIDGQGNTMVGKDGIYFDKDGNSIITRGQGVNTRSGRQLTAKDYINMGENETNFDKRREIYQNASDLIEQRKLKGNNDDYFTINIRLSRHMNQKKLEIFYVERARKYKEFDIETVRKNILLKN